MDAGVIDPTTVLRIPADVERLAPATRLPRTLLAQRIK
jgi:hypothetical protein